MTMFSELYELARSATLVLTIDADERNGALSINVIPKPKGDATDPALSTPLALRAPPAEFDRDFVTVLRAFRGSYTDLAKQAATTTELLEAAKKASAKTGTSAVAKAAALKSGTAPASSAEGDEDEREAADSAASTSKGAVPASAGFDAEPTLFG